MATKPRTVPVHEWATVNRDYHAPDDLTAQDLLAEIAVGLANGTDEHVHEIARAIDAGRYATAGQLLAAALGRINRDQRPAPVRATAGGYPAGWPACRCGQPVLDGHATCGAAACGTQLQAEQPPAGQCDLCGSPLHNRYNCPKC